MSSTQALDPPNLTQLRSLSFWATAYWIHHANVTTPGIPLRDPVGNELGPVLSSKDWCSAALEGTVRVAGNVYNFAESVSGHHVDCSKFFAQDVGDSRFTLATGPFGDGIEGYILVPYRTIAADPAFLKVGTALFIPNALGEALPDGTKHDGYFLVADAGGAIKGHHLDVFQGDQIVPFSFILSKDTEVFKGYVITDSEVVSKLQAIHRPASK